MRRQFLVPVLWLSLALGILAAVLAARSSFAAAPGEAAVTAAPSAAATRAAPRADSDSLARLVASAGLFRVERRPAAIAFDPDRRGDGDAASYRPPRPQLVLRGLVLGDTARALIEGFPQSEGGRLVRAGEVVAGLRIASISAGAVRVASPDTAWVLTLRRVNR